MGNYTQCFVITYKGKESEKKYIYMYIYKLNHCVVHLKLTGYFKSTLLQLKKKKEGYRQVELQNNI